LGLDWVWTGLILFIMILLRCVAVSIPEEFLHVLTYTCTDIIHVPPVSGYSRRQTFYFVGSQADNPFNHDPHHARPAVPLRPPPPSPPLPTLESQPIDRPRQTTPESMERKQQQQSPTRPQRIPTPPPSSRTAGSTTSTSALPPPTKNNSPPPPDLPPLSRASNDLDLDLSSGGTLDPLQESYVNAYSAADLRTFHCERVRKMPLSGLDPSMLLGLLGFCVRIGRILRGLLR
jgi:cysteine protease ATG4